ncbi:MAG: hypothetical protein NT157_06460 [Candidatus Micrarchaeota archaeon]|nr:hypothetical protein [Candidatus Micrarchaeota archaeon]
MYHPGKIVKVFAPGRKEVISAGGATLALVAMWDDNIMTLEIDKKIEKKVGEGDVVLVDYGPMGKIGVPVPRQVITTVLKGETARQTWEKYKKYNDGRKGGQPNAMPPMPVPRYIG